MSYQVPKRWSHGDIPVAADMNKYSDSLNAIHDITGDALRGYPSAKLQAGEDENHFFVHRYRWLWYIGSGTLEDADAENETITLSGDTTPKRYDLSSVSWLTVGKLFYVSDCAWCQETEAP